MRKLTIIVVTLLFLPLFVSGFGIGPAKREFQYADEIDGSFRIVADEVPLTVQLSPEDDLARFIGLEENIIVLEKKETTINYKLTFPEGLRPGNHKGSILVAELTENQDTDKHIVLAKAAIKHQIFVDVPYSGKYAEGKLYITNTAVNEPILFTVSLFNLGNQDIRDVQAHIYIKGPTNEELEHLDTEGISLAKKQNSKVTATWTTEHDGFYYAEVTVNYDDKSFTLRDTFLVGDKKIEIESLVIENFRLGQVAQLDFLLRNKWNQPFNLQGNVQILKKGNQIDSFNTLPASVGARSTSTMRAYWNTQGLEIGNYDIYLETSYGDSSTDKLFDAEILFDEIIIGDLATGKVTTENKKPSINFLALGVAILILLNIFLILYVRQRLRK